MAHHECNRLNFTLAIILGNYGFQVSPYALKAIAEDELLESLAVYVSLPRPDWRFWRPRPQREVGIATNGLSKALYLWVKDETYLEQFRGVATTFAEQFATTVDIFVHGTFHSRVSASRLATAP